MDSTDRRDHVETLRRMGFLADAEYMKPWAEKIGQFIFNFGGIEFVTHKYLLLLEKSEPEFDESLAPCGAFRFEASIITARVG